MKEKKELGKCIDLKLCRDLKTCTLHVNTWPTIQTLFTVFLLFIIT